MCPIGTRKKLGVFLKLLIHLLCSRTTMVISITSTRRYGIAVVRRLFKMGPKMVQRRLRTLRRLLPPLPAAELWSMLKNADAYFSLFPFYYYFLLRALRAKFYTGIVADVEKMVDASQLYDACSMPAPPRCGRCFFTTTAIWYRRVITKQ